MIKISVRQFQLEASKYLDKLPLTLTVYGKPVAIVNTFSESVDTITPENHESVIQTSTTPTNIEPEIDDYGWCQVHFEKGVDYLLKEITWEDENGTPIIDKKLACPKCVEKYQNMGRGKVYFL